MWCFKTVRFLSAREMERVGERGEIQGRMVRKSGE